MLFKNWVVLVHLVHVVLAGSVMLCWQMLTNSLCTCVYTGSSLRVHVLVLACVVHGYVSVVCVDVLTCVCFDCMCCAQPCILFYACRRGDRITFEYHVQPGWEAIRTAHGDRDAGRNHGVVRLPRFFALPGVGEFFPFQLPQDPMHDVDGGVAKFFLLAFLRKTSLWAGDTTTALTNYDVVRKQVPFGDALPKLSARDFADADNLHLSGMY